MRRRIATVLKGMTQQELADIMGCAQPRIAQLNTGEHDVFVHYEGGEITHIQYDRTLRIERKA